MSNDMIELGYTYRIDILKDINANVRLNDHPDDICDSYIQKAGEMDEVEIVDIDHENKTATFYWSGETTDEIDTFSNDIPLDSFEVIQKRITIWEDV